MVEYTCPNCGEYFVSMKGIESLFTKVMDHMARHIEEARLSGIPTT